MHARRRLHQVSSDLWWNLESLHAWFVRSIISLARVSRGCSGSHARACAWQELNYWQQASKQVPQQLGTPNPTKARPLEGTNVVNSGKHVTLETLSLTKFSKRVFRSSEFTIFGSLEPEKPRIRECAKFGNPDSVKNGVTNMRKTGISNCRWLELRRTPDSGICHGLSSGVRRVDMREPANSGNCWRPSSGVSCEDIHETGEKQSQSCCPKKSGFRVWTSDRFVNMLDEKDIPVCVHTRNILWGWGCYRYVKVPSSPYKRGHKGTCKRIQTFWNLCYLQRESQSLCALTLYLNVWKTLSRVRVVIRIFRVTPNNQPAGNPIYLQWTFQNSENPTGDTFYSLSGCQYYPGLKDGSCM
jgi:hypothetical protein